ncbi:hypothetical protein GPL21_18905 [Bradyrhizobium pachyrhizi]|uniref:Uncharacterized protein n=1 Tax=Bradyrhizobium pachyrhizi TaxID=280333 RepID=A0A844STF3_9BRAD|nr:hypothetical protein [Bradyrhizobium pachyrhizi]MVT67174.1 hypothetical protein [Bradyrhizobium pachyrhizi]WFU53881.1 hypothetical protein QA639_30070 [Bradyrhizobium pachyrhizi]
MTVPLSTFQSIWWLLGYAIARLVFPVVSFGKVRVGPILDSHKFNWLGYRDREEGCMEIEATFATLIGLLAFCAGLMVILFFIH